ncbi:MAG TPA: DinB family protein [Gemmatimonadaceae bacterium]
MSNSLTRRPAASEYAPFYETYVKLVPNENILSVLERGGAATQKVLRTIDETKSQHRYAPGKWSIREVVGHIADSERVFTYRALRFARADATELPGFDQDVWATTTNAHSRTLVSLLDELQALRAATITLFRGFDDAAWDRAGVASKNPVTVRALAFIVAGHEHHHLQIVKERYL